MRLNTFFPLQPRENLLASSRPKRFCFDPTVNSPGSPIPPSSADRDTFTAPLPLALQIVLDSCE